MNFTTLHYFLAAAEEQSITRAAARLYISQQALSGHIGKLEEELGVALFDRTPSLSLTYAGRQLKEYAVRIVELERQARQAAGDISNNQRGELRLGISHTCGRALLPAVFPEYRRRYPNVDLKLVEANSTELEADLLRGDIDLMVGFPPLKGENIEYELLLRERILLVAPRALLAERFGGHWREIVESFRARPDMTLFAELPFVLLTRGNRIRTVFDKYAQSVGFRPHVILETENSETAFALAQRGMGLTVYPELFHWCIPRVYSPGEELEYFPLPGEMTEGSLIIAWMRDRYQPRATCDLIALCRDAVRRIEERQQA